MKPRSLIALTSLLAFNITALAGIIETGKTIEFSEQDFNDGSASKQWAIYHPTNQATNTELWETFGINQGTSAIVASSNSTGPTAYATWKIDVPHDMSITGFTWGVTRLVLNGAVSPDGDDKFEWQYSTDGATWITFFSRDNRQSGDLSPVTLNNQVLTVSGLSGTSISSLFIRGVNIEGPIENDSGYFQIWSNPTAGGLNDNAYISLTAINTIPEPSSAVFILGAATLALATLKRTAGRRRLR